MKTHVVMLLDESSSMLVYRSAVVSTFNEYVDGLKKGKRTWLTLCKFAGKAGWGGSHTGGKVEKGLLSVVFSNRNVKDIYKLTTGQYSPNGNTPLYDAIGKLIKQTKKRLPKEAKVLFVVHTDGQENNSKRYNQESIKTMIRKCEKSRNWTFIYLGEGAEAWDAGYDFGIENVANFSSNLRSATMTKLATATVCYTSNSSVGGLNAGSQTFYADANLTADDIDPADAGSISSTVTTKDNTADASTNS